MSKIAIVYMGGTFGCIGEPLYPLPADQFLMQLKNLQLADDLHYFAAPSIKDSSELEPVDWLLLAQYVSSLSHEFQHFILIHGTDTLSYAAAFLHHIFQEKIHLFITGSQNPLLDAKGQQVNHQSDAWVNLVHAIEKIREVDVGVYINFNQKVFSAQNTYKQHTSSLDAFLHNNADTTDYLEKFTLTDQHIKIAQNIRAFNYYVSPAPPEHHVSNLNLLFQNLPNILILQCFGSGNLVHSTELQDCLNNMIKQGCWVIISSQVLFGELSNIYAASSWLSKINAVYDPHHSQSDLLARTILLYLQHGKKSDWQKYWKKGIPLCNDMPLV